MSIEKYAFLVSYEFDEQTEEQFKNIGYEFKKLKK